MSGCRIINGSKVASVCFGSICLVVLVYWAPMKIILRCHPTAHAQLRTCVLVFTTVSCLSGLEVSRQRSQSREEQTDSGRGLRNDQSDCSLPCGRELNLDFTGR